MTISAPSAMTVLAPGHASPLTRRRFLARCAAFGAGASLAGLWGCSNEFEPEETWKLWVAKSLQGTVLTAVGSNPVIGAIVNFRAGLKLNQYALLGSKVTGIGGRYEMSAEEHPSADAGYWRFVIDHSFFRVSSDDVPVYCQVTVSAPGFDEEVRDFILNRKPQKTLPPESEAFHLIQNIQLR
jgi:hypothetical protein